MSFPVRSASISLVGASSPTLSVHISPPPPVDPFGNHLCCCRSGGEVTLRHNQVITCLRELAKLGGILPTPGCSWHLGGQFCPLSSKLLTCDYAYDPSIVHPNGADQLSFLHNPSKGFKAVSSTKNSKYKFLSRNLWF